MRSFSLLALVLLLSCGLSDAQFFRNIFRGFNRGVQNVFRPVMTMFGGNDHHGGNIGQPSFRGSTKGNIDETGGTIKPVATGIDNAFPDDCGRDPVKKTGNLCFPDGLLCQQRVNRVGNENFNGQRYWMSWKSDDPQLRTAEWDWFNARNYCRKRCMDLVSIETREEYEFLKSHMGGVAYTWTSGRLCDFDGCDRPDFFPKDINGWFWSANQVRLAPTNSLNEFHDWSGTGGAGEHQPDNREGSESCLAVLNNFYGDGIKWHDVACHHEKPIICEDVPGHIQFARQNFPQLNIP
ncbi:uncharacterized protein LOC131879961 isoform X1 [Tigriopus californicus]|uniref:uncharacterized protein LOC131879961 isoform X1 n=1 Tax=Tigriopus californicus TaxID=6832 RepID=UPI0027DA4F3F|nr:uncharacterized protein LOC131879961 isoform X1 [Tigriopus californicus]